VRKIKTAIGLALSEWRFLAIASFELFAARIRLSLVPTENILRALQAPLSEPVRRRKTNLGQIEVERLSWAITVAGQLVPWRSDCLVRVLAADRWLRRNHLAPDFYLGVAKDERGVLVAHAWLRCGDLTVTGGTSHQFYTLIEPTRQLSLSLKRPDHVCKAAE
jgi:hypothetical protein